jgi:hypothetical protein
MICAIVNQLAVRVEQLVGASQVHLRLRQRWTSRAASDWRRCWFATEAPMGLRDALTIAPDLPAKTLCP